MSGSTMSESNIQAIESFSGTGAEVDPAELAHVMAGADVGLALFDSERRLLVCNQLYRSLCGYEPEDVKPGRRLDELIRISLTRHRMPEARVKDLIEKSLKRLEPGAAYSFAYTSANSRQLLIGRRRLPSGSIVETVREAVQREDASHVDLNAQFSQIADAARERMMHALDVMADGFALFDAQDRLVVYNRQYVDLCPLIADLIIPGARYEEMLREYGYEAPLNNSERLAEAIAAKEKRQEEILEEPKLPTFSFTKGMIRLSYFSQR